MQLHFKEERVIFSGEGGIRSSFAAAYWRQKPRRQIFIRWCPPKPSHLQWHCYSLDEAKHVIFQDTALTSSGSMRGHAHPNGMKELAMHHNIHQNTRRSHLDGEMVTCRPRGLKGDVKDYNPTAMGGSKWRLFLWTEWNVNTSKEKIWNSTMKELRTIFKEGGRVTVIVVAHNKFSPSKAQPLHQALTDWGRNNSKKMWKCNDLWGNHKVPVRNSAGKNPWNRWN